MKHLFFSRLLPVLWGSLWLLAGSCRSAGPAAAAAAPDTVVYVVRHAEKDLTPGLPDPALTVAGRQRAQALQVRLTKRGGVQAAFSTNTARTRATAQPLAEARQLPVHLYDARQLPALAARLRREYRGQTVLVVGHSNTILETVEALGAARPVPTVADEAYDYLLEVRIPQDSTRAATATAGHYGAVHR
ncbi:histidine phosphatase family protein [Hymenobacter rubripertinctus]|uniref:Histidine phosphatase family protein n=1 Tax=Hymenobacter rubripertinctus TaxID=2029981 RepID=A0A418R0N8_9BACT|nr:histidine phosphatase family protein [Hymenobacter rubripertinctus]RIY10961.1 histidine phosphatase family protein [Hymenobacter rubripertinctus]